ncbi:putative general amino acid permease [Truncatella angustata]|uniref:General amino acid permease n=1 Tax=Truncatella angustata TaxID=152316 RepID=A0A9P8UNK8_9PEZI|nr:putative general amino acid permease [Truncatella angustata]KAH6655392.1 putative general amino acid permease [Truncatella angustata]
MASSGVDYVNSPTHGFSHDKDGDDPEKYTAARSPSSHESLHTGQIDQTHRKLKSRHIQLIGIGGTIGTALYVQIGKSLIAGGPANLFLAFTLWCTVILAVTISMAEMVTYLPISSPFIRFAGRWIDESIGFATGWNFFIFEAALVPFEVTACNLIIHFWSDAVPVGGVIAIIVFLYGLINILAVKWYGETEFWAALGKMLLIVGLIVFTFIVMVGGNPAHDHFGFRYWYEPGAFATYYHTGDLGRFMGFMQCLIAASFTIAGPDYVSMAAGEAENPRKVMPRAFNAVFYRLTSFFMLGSLCVGILVPYNDQTLKDAFTNGEPGAAASPYVVAMNRLGIPVLPHIINAMVLTAAFSAGNSYVYCASRSLFGLALEGKAPKFLTICLKNGVPIYSVIIVLLISLLSFLQVSSNTATVLSWFVSLITASQLINYCVVCVTYICFYRALKAQGIDRKTLPYMGKLQPYAAWYACVMTFVMAFMNGYTIFLPGNWDISSFLFSYMMIFLFPVLFLVWKVIHRTRFHKPAKVDLQQDLAGIEEYTRNYVPEKST